MSPIVGVPLLALVLSGGAWAFVPTGGGASSHISITQSAVLLKVTKVCQVIALSEGLNFILTGDSAEELVEACLGPTAIGEVSAAKFKSALNEINKQHSLVDRDFVNSPQHHFNSERFILGRSLITEGVASIKANVRVGNFHAARETLGRVLHTLQDFYSHSNWVDLGNTKPYIELIRPDLPLENLADVNTPTCKDCTSGGFCSNSVLPDILRKKKLTSGYIGISSPVKPKGKCSHGGASDRTSSASPHGGISKDERRPDNEALHSAAVSLATTASLQLLDNIQSAAGDNNFLRLMGVARSSVVAFVIDTTGSMTTDIIEAKRMVNDIIDSKKGTQDEPSQYILVPFNDPEFGPLIRTTDPNIMKAEVAKLTASGGGDLPEMCLSGLQLALTGSPASSYIYVFTDAPAKDISLKNTIDALIRSTKSTVSFFITDGGDRSRKKRSVGIFDIYNEQALASGGQAIRVSKANLPQATDIIADSSTSSLVTVLQRARNSNKAETFSFQLDESLTNVTIYITGDSLTFTLKNPTGVTQTENEASGKLGAIQKVGNLYRIRLAFNIPSGLWEINMNSNQPYTLKVTGQSTIAFIYNFVESFGGPHPGYAPIAGRPQSGVPAILLVSVLGRKGPASVKVSDVALVTVSGSEVVGGTLEDMGIGDFLVTVTKVPAGEFVVLVNGNDLVSDTLFQRQSTTQMSVSNVIIVAVVDRTMEPGKAFSLPFTVMTNSTGGPYTINARNDKDFTMKFPGSLVVGTEGNATGDLTITAPANTGSGTDITLTIEAVAPGSVDSNYAVLRLSVVTKVTDFTPPQCEVVNVSVADCLAAPGFCNGSFWQLSANLTDGVNGTGIATLTSRQGIGSLTHTDLKQMFVAAHFNASCCSLTVELVAVDKAMNVGVCRYSIVRSSVPPSLALTLPLWSCLLVSAFFTTPYWSPII